MNGRQDQSDRTKAATHPKRDELADDRWLADLPNDLAAISLSTDEIAPLHPGMMGCVEAMSTTDVDKPHHKHIGVGL